MKDTDLQLVKKVQEGNKQAFDLLVLKYQHKVHSLISRFITDNSEIQDVAQETFIKAYRAMNSFRAESAFYTWLYRIAVNTAKNYLVSRSRRPPSVDVDVNESEQYAGSNILIDYEDPQSIFHGDEMASLLRSVFASLPEDLRTAISLREFDGLSYDQISSVMGSPIGTVRSRIFRARDAIEKQLRERENK